eukprot:766813-Hanusia_phi.AAC.7
MNSYVAVCSAVLTAPGEAMANTPMAVPMMANSMSTIFEHPCISVQQTKRGCLQECLGCEAKSEFKVFPGHVEQGQPKQEGIQQIGHLLEESSCPKRFCCGEMRSFRMPLTLGDKAGGQQVLEYTKPWSLPICIHIKTDGGSIDCPCCCCLPKLHTKLPNGTPLGSTEYYCDLFCFVPKFRVRDGTGAPVYRISPDTCCCNCCISCGCGGKGSKCFYIPFYIRDHSTNEKLNGALPGTQAEIRKVWSGFKKECCTTADNFQVWLTIPQAAGLWAGCLPTGLIPRDESQPSRFEHPHRRHLLRAAFRWLSAAGGRHYPDKPCRKLVKASPQLRCRFVSLLSGAVGGSVTSQLQWHGPSIVANSAAGHCDGGTACRAARRPSDQRQARLSHVPQSRGPLQKPVVIFMPVILVKKPLYQSWVHPATVLESSHSISRLQWGGLQDAEAYRPLTGLQKKLNDKTHRNVARGRNAYWTTSKASAPAERDSQQESTWAEVCVKGGNSFFNPSLHSRGMRKGRYVPSKAFVIDLKKIYLELS